MADPVPPLSAELCEQLDSKPELVGTSSFTAKGKNAEVLLESPLSTERPPTACGFCLCKENTSSYHHPKPHTTGTFEKHRMTCKNCWQSDSKSTRGHRRGLVRKMGTDFSRACCDRTRSDGSELEDGKFRVDLEGTCSRLGLCSPGKAGLLNPIPRGSRSAARPRDLAAAGPKAALCLKRKHPFSETPNPGPKKNHELIKGLSNGRFSLKRNKQLAEEMRELTGPLCVLLFF